MKKKKVLLSGGIYCSSKGAKIEENEKSSYSQLKDNEGRLQWEESGVSISVQLIMQNMNVDLGYAWARVSKFIANFLIKWSFARW